MQEPLRRSFSHRSPRRPQFRHGVAMQHRGERVVACARRRACLPAQAWCLPASLSGCLRGASARNRRARAIPVEPAGTGERQGSGSESTRAAGSTFGPSLLTPPVPPAARAADRAPRERSGPPPHPRGRRRGIGCWRARRPPQPEATDQSRRAPQARGLAAGPGLGPRPPNGCDPSPRSPEIPAEATDRDGSPPRKSPARNSWS